MKRAIKTIMNATKCTVEQAKDMLDYEMQTTGARAEICAQWILDAYHKQSQENTK